MSDVNHVPISSYLEHEVDLSSLHTFRTLQSADMCFRLKQKDVLPELSSWILSHKLLYLFLGIGANIVFRQDYPGIIIKNEIKGLEIKSETEDEVRIVVGSGMILEYLISYCLNCGWHGLENLSGIPSTIGAAALQNIGAYGLEMQDLVKHLYAFDFHNQRYISYTHEQLEWGYRSSLLHPNNSKGEIFVYAVELMLSKKYKPIFSHQSLQHLSPNLTPEQMREYILNLRAQKLPSIHEIGNSGSFFKNPFIPLIQANKLSETYPDLPIYHSSNPQVVKVSAAYLIENCGWKGQRLGAVGVYAKHALILVNLGGARGADIINLVNQIQQSVWQRFAIMLEPEVQMK